MSLLDISVRLIVRGHHHASAHQASRATAVLVSGTFLVMGIVFPSSGTAGVLDRFRSKKPSTRPAAVTIPTVVAAGKVVNTSHYESAGDGDTGPDCDTSPTCSDGTCESSSGAGFWRRMVNKMTDHKRRWRRKMYFEHHFSNKRMLYPVCPPFGTANHGYFPTCWRQFPETDFYCPPPRFVEPPAADAAAQSPAAPHPVPAPPSPDQPVPAPTPGR